VRGALARQRRAPFSTPRRPGRQRAVATGAAVVEGALQRAIRLRRLVEALDPPRAAGRGSAGRAAALRAARLAAGVAEEPGGLASGVRRAGRHRTRDVASRLARTGVA